MFVLVVPDVSYLSTSTKQGIENGYVHACPESERAQREGCLETSPRAETSMGSSRTVCSGSGSLSEQIKHAQVSKTAKDAQANWK